MELAFRCEDFRQVQRRAHTAGGFPSDRAALDIEGAAKFALRLIQFLLPVMNDSAGHPVRIAPANAGLGEYGVLR